MLEDKTANNVIKRYHRILMGDQNQLEAGGNPNKVVTVTGTLADPWGDLDPAELLAGLNDNSITMWLSATMGGQTSLPICPRKGDASLYFSFIAVVGGLIEDGIIAHYMLPDWSLVRLYVLTGGVVTDYSAYANLATTELTVIYHPLPEE